MNLSIQKLDYFINDYIGELKIERNLSPNTIKAYTFDLNHLSSFLASQVTSDSIDPKIVWKYFEYILDEKRLKDSTVKRKYISIKSFFKYLVSRDVIEDSPFKGKRKSFKISKRLPKTLSKLEVKHLLNAPRQELKSLKSTYRRNICIRNIAILELIYSTGIRIGELVNINLEDLNLYDLSLLIFGKGRRERMLYISSSEVIKEIKTWLDMRSFFNPTTNALFVNKFGDRLSIYSIENIFYKYRQLAGINSKATPHFLRHSFATELLNNGANIRVVQEILGHSNISTTEIYTEVSTHLKKDTLQKYNPRNDLY